MKTGSRVRLLRGRFAGRTGAVAKECRPPFAEYVYVLLDRVGRERTDKRAMVARTDLEEVSNAL